MNQKDYKAIAEIINKAHIDSNVNDRYKQGCNETVKLIAHELADCFEVEEERGREHFPEVKAKFDRKQFLKECGVTE